MVLSFPVMADYAALLVDGHAVYATHGHIYNDGNPPPLQAGDILLFGHTHIPCCRRHGGFTFVNPGSVSIPKQNTPHSYVTLEDGVMTWKDLAGGEYMRERVW
jgi:putative phosphoesterase